MKDIITKKFDKSKFSIDAMSTHDMGDIDPRISDFIFDLNKSDDIITIYSCEGHQEDDNAYMYFSVNEKGWDIFWLNVMPELASKFYTKIGYAGHQMEWLVSVDDNDFNIGGIAIHCILTHEEHDIFSSWEEKKEKFWKVIEETFLKYYK